MSDLTPDPNALRMLQEMEQMEAALRGIADTVVTIRRTLVEGGFPDDVANAMAMRAWNKFFPGTHPLSQLFGTPEA